MRVNVDSKAASDPRFKKLGARLARPWQEALGRCVLVWFYAYENRSPLATRDDVDALAELAGFADAMLAADLATVHEEPVLRLRGVHERIEFLLMQDRKREAALAAKRKKLGLPAERPAGPSCGTVPRDAPRVVPISPDLPPNQDQTHARAQPRLPATWQPEPWFATAIRDAGFEPDIVLEGFRSAVAGRVIPDLDGELLAYVTELRHKRFEADYAEHDQAWQQLEATTLTAG